MPQKSNVQESKWHPELPHIIVEVDDAKEFAGNINDHIIRPVSASEAFRKYQWLRDEPVLNSAGNLRGMVVSARMRTVYNISTSFGKKILLLNILIEVGGELRNSYDVYQSNRPIDEKGPLILSMLSMALLRAVSSPIPAGAHILALSLEGYCKLAEVMSKNPTQPLALERRIENMDRWLTSTHKQVFNGQNYYNLISQHLN